MSPARRPARPSAPARLTYRAAGVDIDAGDAAVRRLAPWARSTYRPEVLGDIGAFAGFFRIPRGYRQPVLLASTDGVGSKLRVAFLANRHDTIGIDLVAMGVNDLLVHGAEPLVFLDYVGTQPRRAAHDRGRGPRDRRRLSRGRLRPHRRRDRGAARLLRARGSTIWPASRWGSSSAAA